MFKIISKSKYYELRRQQHSTSEIMFYSVLLDVCMNNAGSLDDYITVTKSADPYFKQINVKCTGLHSSTCKEVFHVDGGGFGVCGKSKVEELEEKIIDLEDRLQKEAAE